MACRYANAKYMTIADRIVERFRAGEFHSDGRFYSRDELAKAYHIAPGTATAVLRILEDRNIISCRRGRRPVLASPMPPESVSTPCRTAFLRPAATAETPEYDYIAYCARNLIRRDKSELAEFTSEPWNPERRPKLEGKDVAIVFPPPDRGSAATGGEAGNEAESAGKKPSVPGIEVVFNRVSPDALSIFSRKACLDCLLHLIQHGLFTVVHVASAQTVFPWYARLARPGTLAEYAPGANTCGVVFDGDPEEFPAFLREQVLPGLPGGPGCTAVLMDDPYLSDYLSGEIRAGGLHVPPGCFLFGTAMYERPMVFPYLNLKLDRLASSILHLANLKASRPAAELPCYFHVVEFMTPDYWKF